jgi:ribosomal protein S14
MHLAYLVDNAGLSCRQAHSATVLRWAMDQFVATPIDGALTSLARPTSKSEESLMTKLDNRCASCGGKFGLVCHYHWGLRFCRKACKASYLAKTARDYACIRKWLG